MRRLTIWAGAIVLALAVAWVFLRIATRNVEPPERSVAPTTVSLLRTRPRAAPAAERPCRAAPAFAQAALQNATSLTTAAWSVFGRPETGWAIYAPMVAHELGTACPPDADGFAQALAKWQSAQSLPANGVMDEPTLRALDLVWLRRRPFVAATAGGACPPPPGPDRLVQALPAEGYEGEAIRLRPGALAAYRRMVAAARAEDPAIAADRRLLTIFSGYRDPAADALRCLAELNCGGAARANCSAHRTGLAMDIFLGAAPGYDVASSADANRFYQSRTPAYRWLVANAARFGFVNYPFEPWHWEWTGEPP
ncbi:MAG TPA: D-alanyl-D-alanine carboxypeptidase family protein [Caulobacteraceae bacterium]|nr:D-alanyl-D-alanine carboxypeptidase family protein [Caulobacteraceae bacterium]